jgi:hypothetical protein
MKIAESGNPKSEDFRVAHERAVTRAGAPTWRLMSVRDQATAIYAELRALDAERLAQQQKMTQYARAAE